MTRRLEARASGGEGDPGKPLRLTGPPKETITLSIEIDAADQLEEATPMATQMGIYPSLSALEMMFYPKLTAVNANTVLSLIGSAEIVLDKIDIDHIRQGRPGDFF